MSTKLPFYFGCPEWGNPRWKGRFFPKKSSASDFLELYSQTFNTVEGNTTFYALPKAESVLKWKATTPETFKFCFKFSKTISHQLRLRHAQQETQLFLKCLAPLEERLGPFFLQLPADFAPEHLEVLHQFLRMLPSDFQYAVEVRHPGFFDRGPQESALNEMLRSVEVSRMNFDTELLHVAKTEDEYGVKAQGKKPRVPMRNTATTRTPFVRFVGHPDNEQNHERLQQWVQTLAHWVHKGGTPYFFIHAPDEAHAPALAKSFYEFLQKHLEIPTFSMPQVHEPDSDQLSFGF